ncbi:MAG: short-chain fatty acid transporter, partial [Desulfobacteraceae bacterium]
MLRRLAAFFTLVMRSYLPDAYLFAILLTFLSVILALIFTPSGFMKVVTSWGDGIYGIIAFAFQMILILITGHALALTPAVNRVLMAIASIGSTPIKAGMTVALVGGVCSWLNWGFGLIVSGLLAVEIARRNREVDFPYLVAAGYSGFVVWHMGLSGSIPLVCATAKSAQNFIEKATGAVVPVSDSIFQAFNLLPALIIILTMPLLYALIHPKAAEVKRISPEKLKEVESITVKIPLPPQATLAQRIDHSYVINIIFGLLGVIYLYNHFSTKGFDLNLNIVIFIFFISGVLLHGKPVNYINAIATAIKGAGAIALQFPLYGGIQGIMVGTGLASVIAGWFVALSSPETFYM